MDNLTERDASLGDLIRRRRAAVGMEQQTLAEITKVSPRTIRDIENGNVEGRTRRTTTVEKLLGALGLSVDALQKLSASTSLPEEVESLLSGAVTPGSARAVAPVVYPFEAFVDAFELTAEAAERLRVSLDRNGAIHIR